MRQRRLTGIDLLIRRDIDRFRRAEVAIRQGVEEVVEHPAVIERLPVRTEDFYNFDLIIGMDDQNIRDLQRMATSEEEKNKIFKMTDFCQRFSYRDSVPDPYYGGDSGFELVLDLLEDAVEGLLDQLENK